MPDDRRLRAAAWARTRDDWRRTCRALQRELRAARAKAAYAETVRRRYAEGCEERNGL